MEPIFLSSIVISADPRTEGPAPLASALARAIPGRAALANRCSPCDGTTGTVDGGEHVSHPPMPREEEEERMAVFVSEVTFARSKAQVRSLHWQAGAVVEVCVSSRHGRIFCSQTDFVRQAFAFPHIVAGIACVYMHETHIFRSRLVLGSARGCVVYGASEQHTATLIACSVPEIFLGGGLYDGTVDRHASLIYVNASAISPYCPCLMSLPAAD